MPIYEYACLKCGAHREVMQKTSDKLLTKCGECGGKLEKQWSQTSMQFKGTGWYVTDYAGKQKGDEKSDGAKGSEAKSDETKASATKEATDKSGSTSQANDGAAGKKEKSSPAKPAANAKS